VKLPYGIADFYHLITGGYRYVDRTAHIRTVEDMGEALLFLRPRRFGKSLWLRTLQTYYDLRFADEHERIFGRLAIGRAPTPLAHRYFVLVWDFSKIAPRGSSAEIARRLASYINNTVHNFSRAYRDVLPEPIPVEEDPVATLGHLLGVISSTPHKLYLLVDEYDNFANEVMVAGEENYRRLVHADGPFKAIFKWVKAAMAGEGLERLFLTGVSPLVISDITSGLNLCRNVYLHPHLAQLCGFREPEIEELLEELFTELRETGAGDPAITPAEALATMRDWYDGYRFAPGPAERIYNPTLTLYFLLHLQEQQSFPRQMLDANLAADEEKLRYLGRAASGRRAMIDLVQTGKPLEVSQLEERFTLGSMLDRGSQDVAFLASYLYYTGMLTLAGETPQQRLRLVPPNRVAERLYIDEVRRFLLPAGIDRSAATEPALKLLAEGEIGPLQRFVEEKIFKVFGKADYLWMDEQALKTAFLVLLFDDINYVMRSEPELARGHADLCLLRRPDRRAPGLWDVLFELKYLKLGHLGGSARELRVLGEGELEELPAVARALEDAEAQLRRYGRALAAELGGALRLRCYAVVALGFERLVVREVPFEPGSRPAEV
jgi:hypothetical protein